MAECLWSSSDKQIAASRIAQFTEEFGPFADYDELWKWSVQDREVFW